MKKILLTLVLTFVWGCSTGFAAPVNYMSADQTAVGIATDNFFLKHKFSDTFTVGYQNINWDHAPNSSDIYGHYHFSRTFGGIVGVRDFGDTSDTYVGVSVHAPLAPKWDGYASIIGGSDFKELEAGANVMISRKFDLNIFYRSFMPDYGEDNNKVGASAIFKL